MLSIFINNIMSSYDPEYHKKYYQTHKDKHLAYCKERVVCKVCNGEYSRNAVTAHRKTLRHQSAVELNEMRIKYQELQKKHNKLKAKYYKLKSDSE